MSLSKKQLRWGIIGCGDVTEVKSGPAYSLIPEFELYGVMRRNLDKAKDYAQRHGVPVYTNNADEIIENPEIDAVYIATPPDTHKYYGLQVAAAGKPCCIEKPMAPTFADSLAIYNAFEKAGQPLFIAYYRRSLPRFLKVKQWLDENRIGEVRHVRWLKCRSASPEDLSGTYNWRTDAKIAPGGYFDDLASHGLDLFAFLFGDFKKVHGFGANQQGLYSSFDAITGSWVHESGVTGEGSWIFGAKRLKDVVEIYGSQGEIRFSIFENSPLELISENHNENLVIDHPKHIQEFHVANIKEQLLNGKPHPSTGATGLHTSWVMDKILGIS